MQGNKKSGVICLIFFYYLLCKAFGNCLRLSFHLSAKVEYGLLPFPLIQNAYYTCRKFLNNIVLLSSVDYGVKVRGTVDIAYK